jgi:hypothetical protein
LNSTDNIATRPEGDAESRCKLVLSEGGMERICDEDFRSKRGTTALRTYALNAESIELLRRLLAAHRDGLEFIFRKSFSPDVAGVYGRLVNDSDIQISDELQMTIELIELLDGEAVISGV